MKIYVNVQHQIKGVRTRPESDTDGILKEIEVDDNFLNGWCDTVIKGYCYQVNDDESVAIYPYKDFELLMSIQQIYEEKEKQVLELQLALTQVFETVISNTQ